MTIDALLALAEPRDNAAMNKGPLRALCLTAAVLASACNGSTPDASTTCEPDFLLHPSYVPLAKRSPDGKGWCCQPSLPTCSCGSLGGFVRERCHCGEVPRAGVEIPSDICDLAPPDWILEKDAHGCMAYRAQYPPTACCNCPSQLGDGGR